MAALLSLVYLTPGTASSLRLFSQGTLAGFDQRANVVLSDSKERVYSIDEGVEEVPLGLYLVKGDMMCVHLARFYYIETHNMPCLFSVC